MKAVLERNVEELTCDAYNDDPTRVRRVARQMPSSDAFESASALLKAVADPVRARILYALTYEPLCVCEVARLLDMSLPAVSHHLKILTMAGLLRVRKEGKFACYYRNEHHQGRMLVALVSDLTLLSEAPDGERTALMTMERMPAAHPESAARARSAQPTAHRLQSGDLR